MNNTNKTSSLSGAMKFLKISAIGTMLLSVGSTYAFNPDTAFATEQNDGQTAITQVTDSDYAALTKSLSTYHYNDVRADHYAFSSIEWAASKNLFNDGGSGDFHPNASVTESELMSVIANYFNISDSYDEFAKYQLSLNGYSDTNLRNHYVKLGEFAQIISELTSNSDNRGNLDEALTYLNNNKIIDVGTVTEGTSISDLAGSELLLDKAQLAVLMQKVSNHKLMISSKSNATYLTNSDKSMNELVSTIDKDNVVAVANATTTTDSNKDISTSKITQVSNSNDAPSGFVIGKDTDTYINMTPEQIKKLEKENAHDKLVEKYMAKVEKDRAPVKGAKIKKYTHYPSKDYVKGGKVYEYYKVSWTKTKKIVNVGIPVRTATSYDKAIYSKTGNHVDSRAKLTSNQKRIIATLKKSKTYSKKYRYIALYRYNTASKLSDLYIIPKSGKSAAYEIDYRVSAFVYDNKDNILIPISQTVKAHNANLKVAYNLNILTHKATLKEWQIAMGGGYKSQKSFYGYGIIGNYMANKIN
ncbi:S-layer homology domain-containing protein [Rummeliibacillus suwonensis]|uniref:S-layer homology domain-containing protein n=1 Tax=Rummeliibacillus suwonensis TaxID=1306154 RepID=UPI0028A09475|nr:S-layer homology domain-containing protein [Rummeliibacillus suwonensis]